MQRQAQRAPDPSSRQRDPRREKLARVAARAGDDARREPLAYVESTDVPGGCE